MLDAKHNNPPDPIDEATAPFADVIAEAENWLDGEPVTTEGQMKDVDRLTKEVKAALKAVKDGEKSEAAPLYDAWKAEKARWKPTIDDLDRMVKGLVALVGPFKAKIAAEKAEAERLARVEAEKKRREAEAAARAADAADIEAQREAAQAMEDAKEAQKAASKASKETVKGMRTVHRHEITDHRAALHWIAQHDKPAMTVFIESYVAKHTKTTTIDGVRAWTEKEAF